jgi:hypothetical protein
MNIYTSIYFKILVIAQITKKMPINIYGIDLIIFITYMT